MTTREIIGRYASAYRALPEASKLLLVSALVVDVGAAVAIVDGRYVTAVMLAAVAFVVAMGALTDRFTEEEREHDKAERDANGNGSLA